jgi:predicted esterase
MNRGRLWLLLPASVVFAYGAYRWVSGKKGGTEMTGTSEESESEEAPIVEWCAAGLEAIPGGGCYAAPEDRGSPRPLVIYLHGIFEKGPLEDQELERQARVARKGVAAGFAVVALRGALGACGIAPERATTMCWPSNERTAYRGASFVAGWHPALQAAAERHPFSQRYILGFSNGGYFAGLIAVRALFDADAFVVAHAGPVEPVKPLGSMPPLLLLSADSDLSQESMVRFDDELASVHWPHEHHVRDGGHELPDSDIEAALTFFTRTRTETPPFQPSMSTRIPRARQADAAAPPEALPATTLPASDAESSPPPDTPSPGNEPLLRALDNPGGD